MDGSTAGVDEVAEPVSKQREVVILKRVSKVSSSCNATYTALYDTTKIYS
jgi:hypothetical protein